MVALLFAGGLVGLATIDPDEDGDGDALTMVTSSTTTPTSTSGPTSTSAPTSSTAGPSGGLVTTSSASSTTTPPLPTTTVAGSGLGAGGSPVVSGSQQTAETGAESLLLPGLGLLALGLAGRRLRR